VAGSTVKPRLACWSNKESDWWPGALTGLGHGQPVVVAGLGSHANIPPGIILFYPKIALVISMFVCNPEPLLS